jgi:4-hydroxyphenylpyruvate dioxygenase
LITEAVARDADSVCPLPRRRTLSLGSFEHHSIESKFAAAKEAGFANVELFDNDWFDWRDSFAKRHNLPPSTDGDDTSHKAARALADLVKTYSLEFSCYQPLRAFEGFVSAEDRQKSYDNALGVLSLLPILGIDLILCCSTCTPAPETTGDLDVCARDLGWLADRAAELSPPARVMYEALSFGAHKSRWQEVWDVIALANRPNLGICLDSFNFLAREWADPYSEDGKRLKADDHIDASLAELVATIPGDKIYLYQVADGRRMVPAMTPPEDPMIPRLRPWSRSHRLYPCEYDQGAYLPVDKFSDAVIKAGYKGTWSLEVFNDSLSDPSPEVPREHAERGYVGLVKTMQEAFERNKVARE